MQLADLIQIFVGGFSLGVLVPMAIKEWHRVSVIKGSLRLQELERQAEREWYLSRSQLQAGPTGTAVLRVPVSNRSLMMSGL